MKTSMLRLNIVAPNEAFFLYHEGQISLGRMGTVWRDKHVADLTEFWSQSQYLFV